MDRGNKNNMDYRYVPPHLRKKQCDGSPSFADTAELTPEKQALKLKGADPTQSQLQVYLH